MIAAKATGDSNAFYWYQIFALDSAVDEAQTMLSLHGGFLTIAMYHQHCLPFTYISQQ